MKSHLPKVLHPLAGRPLLQHIVQAVKDAGVSRPVIVVGRNGHQIQEVIGDAVVYCRQEEPLGTGHALAQAQSAVGPCSNLLVINGDTPLVTAATLRRLMQAHAASPAVLSLLTARPSDSDNRGRVQRDEAGHITRVVEAATAEINGQEISVGAYCFRSAWLWANLPALSRQGDGEPNLADLVATATAQGQGVNGVAVAEAAEAVSIDSRVQLAQAEAILRQRIRLHLMESGVTLIDPATTYIDADVVIAADTTIYPNTFILGRSRIGARCHIGPNTIVSDSQVGDGCRILASVVEGATLAEGVDVGPFSHLRPGTQLDPEVHIGNFAEVKQSRLGRGTKMGHFSYIGDAQVGDDVNIGAGTITCNFDGTTKHQTIIGHQAFIGSDTMLIAPVRVGDGAKTGAGAVINRDVPANSLAVGVPARIRNRGQKKGGRNSSGKP